MRADIAEMVSALPANPGVYLLKNAGGEIFYIGKAQNLRYRVRSYYSGADTRAFVALLDHLLFDIEVVLTHSEKEAMLVERELIKQHQPRFNVELKDDKQYLCLRLDTRQGAGQAEEVLRRALVHHPPEGVLIYNLACYACVQGRMDEARDFLGRSISGDPDTIIRMALRDPDLAALWPWVEELREDHRRNRIPPLPPKP